MNVLLPPPPVGDYFTEVASGLAVAALLVAMRCEYRKLAGSPCRSGQRPTG